ncbi:acetyl-CoA carboxylase biotin carboxyl carrier protein subunit [Alkalitalea saponilacus]|uniref:Biotin-requiring enzyme n=1 Tax=Alkalitalea saponilacus TaxID=889453 RepID=A0A1T5D2T5_9BACT|nr:acetyl-CoA carboxylase biotin carboxyl carrier protein subunit [Alkalitalea saponilacus]ASB50555.1 acetyl-CoA carboxylase biotin carboxyl carrier protein subunit [Alkalitalea saponilacus]SKB65926.1 Biotin-requiring enzyme [Alkalitalea saponilacus]
MKMMVQNGKINKTVKVIEKEGDIFKVSINNKVYELDVVKAAEGVYSILYKGRSIGMEMIESGEAGNYKVNTLHNYFELKVIPAILSSTNGNAKKLKNLLVKAPMSGKIVKLKVKKGDTVEAGTPLIVLSAMKMENEITSEIAGTVEKIDVSEESLVKEGQSLIHIKSN